MQYDNAGRLLSVGSGIQGSSCFFSNYKYTGGRLSQVQTNGQQTVSTSDSDNATYEYYPDGKIKKITYPRLNDGSLLTTEYVYNALGRMTSLVNKKGSTVLSQYSYTYDANGNIISVNDGVTSKTYVYDKLNRLISILPQSGKTTSYSYDLMGNRKTEVSDRMSMNFTNTSFTYRLDNQLQTVTKGSSAASMEYYPDGLRAKKTTSSGTTHYVYDLSGRLVAEGLSTTVISANYVWGPDRVLEKKDSSGGIYYYLFNGHGDVIQMVDRNGNVVNNYKYDEWGNIETSNETISNPFKYAGEVYDQDTGLYYLRARYYDPSVGRFINEDTNEGQINNPLSLNLYSYCFNSPNNYIDSTGNTPTVVKLYDDLYWYCPDDKYDNAMEELYGGIIPFGGYVYKWLYKSMGVTLITNEKINITFDTIGISSKIADIIKDDSFLASSLRVLSKVTNAISGLLTLGGVVNALGFDKSWQINQLITEVFGDIYGSTVDEVISKYFVALSAINYMIDKDMISYSYNKEWVTMEFDVNKDGQEIIDRVQDFIDEYY